MTRLSLILLGGVLLATPALAWTPFNGASDEALAIQNLQNQMAFEGLMNRAQQQQLHNYQPFNGPIYAPAPAPLPASTCHDWLSMPNFTPDARQRAYQFCVANPQAVPLR